jgi:branched-chain amino acid transport system permease protein
MNYIASTGMLIGIYVILASSYNLIIGYGGLNTVAHPIFFALGAYTTALLGIHTGLPALPCVVAGVGVAVLVSVVLALTTLRISGDYLLIASLGFQLGLLQLVNNFEFTGGPAGLSDIPSTITGAARGPAFLAICAVLAVSVLLAIRRLMAGPFGRAVRAMRDDELACAALGRGLTSIKVLIYAFGSGTAGIAGGLYAYYYQYISPDQFTVAQSATILTMVVLGGIGTTMGPLVGAVVLIALPQAINFLHLPAGVVGPLQGMIFTSLVILFLFLRPKGLVGGSVGAARLA